MTTILGYITTDYDNIIEVEERELEARPIEELIAQEMGAY